jgi:hypothetical protein
LSGLLIGGAFGDIGAAGDERVRIADACQGFMVELARSR